MMDHKETLFDQNNSDDIKKIESEKIEAITPLQKPMRVIRRDKYNSKNLLNPKSQEHKDKYFRIYEDYVVHHLTEKQLAEKYDLTIFTISRAIKWVVHQIGDIDPDVQLRTLVDKQKKRQQEIKAYMQSKKKSLTTSERVQLWQELRRIDAFVSKLSGIMSNALIEVSDKRTVNVITNDGFQKTRRSGANEKKSDLSNEEEE